MNSKVLAHLLPQRLHPARKFPHLRLSTKYCEKVVQKKFNEVGFNAFDQSSLEFISREVDSGSIVELRGSHQNLVGLGFFEAEKEKVEVFEWFRPGALTTIDEDYFLIRISDAVEKRNAAAKHFTNTFRMVHSFPDGLPSLFIDQFSERFFHLRAASRGADRILPALVEWLYRRGAEEVILQSPSIEAQRLTLKPPTVELPTRCLENGITFCWERSCDVHQALISTAFRHPRYFLRHVAENKRVLCMQDRFGMGALNALLAAEKVMCASQDKDLIDLARKNILYNHGAPIFSRCETSCGALEGMTAASPFDVIFLEHHPSYLGSALQWEDTVDRLFQKQLVGPQCTMIVCIETAESMAWKGMEKIFLNVFQRHGRVGEKIRSFSETIDYPKGSLPYTSHFTHVFVVK